MKKIYSFFYIFLFCFLSLVARSQNAPLTTAGELTTAIPGNVVIPVSVDGFADISSFTLTLEYQPLVLTFLSGTPNAAFVSGFSVTSSPGINGKYNVIISWSGDALTLNGGAASILADITFIYNNTSGLGFTVLSWYDNGSSCEYVNGSAEVLTDSPTADFYINGLVTSQLSPISYLPEMPDAFSGVIWIPVTVDNFTNIAGISLEFEYDPNVMTYANDFTSPVSGVYVGTQSLPDGNMKFSVGRYGDAASLSDGATLVNVKFNFSPGTTLLSWLDDGESCEYTDEMYNSLYDRPQEVYYVDGLVEPILAPMVVADTLTAQINDLVTVPIRVYGFTNVNAYSLTLDYDPAVLTFECASPDMNFSDAFIAGASDPGRIEMGWFDIETSLADGSILMYLTFQYHGGVSDLTWYNNGPTCEFTSSELYQPMYDLPTADFYKNGKILPGLVWTGATSNDWDLVTNWQDNIAPDNTMDLIIDGESSPSNWPLYSGNFQVGQQCKSLTLKGDAEMEVSGSMTIQPGTFLEMSGSGLLEIGADWNNFGIFNPGTGTVEFTGATDGSIDEGSYPLSSISAYTVSTFAVGMTELIGGSAGPTGDNAHSDVAIGFTFNYLGIDYRNLRINTNGWVSMDLSGEDNTSALNNNLFFPYAPGNALAPWWDDLLADGQTTVSYKSNEGVFTVEWKNILSFYSGASTRLNFQLKLYSTGNIIEFCYGDLVAGTHHVNESASIGIKDAEGGYGHFTEAITGDHYTATTCMVSDTDWPAVNYRFSPSNAGFPETFWKIIVSKINSGLSVKKDVNVVGTTP